MSFEKAEFTMPRDSYFEEASPESLQRYFGGLVLDVSSRLAFSLNEQAQKENPELVVPELSEKPDHVDWIDLILTLPGRDTRIQIYHHPRSVDLLDKGVLRKPGDIVISFGRLEGSDAGEGSWSLFLFNGGAVWNRQPELSRWVADNKNNKLILHAKEKTIAGEGRDLIHSIVKSINEPKTSIRRISWRGRGEDWLEIESIEGGGRRVQTLILTRQPLGNTF